MAFDHVLLAVIFAIFGKIILYDLPKKNNDQPSKTIATEPAIDVNNLECIDRHELCEYWSNIGQCQRNHTRILHLCPVTCDACDDLGYNENSKGCPHKYPNCEDCSDKSTQCKHWKRHGECDKHPGYMNINCAKSCKYCHLQSDYNLRCPKNEEYMMQTRVFKEPGDLNKFFKAIVDTYNMHKNLTENRDDGVINWELEILSYDPWVLRFDNFVSVNEAKGIIDAAHGKFERSTDVGKKDSTGHFAKVTSTSRTSSNAWCHEKCWNHPMVQTVMQRAETVLNISMDNTEHLQILEYKKNQFYKTHHDLIPNHEQMSCGPRILTWFMYLSDVEEGGGTDFPRLKITNPPKLGRVILWPSVLDGNPEKIDKRTYHQALPVIKGVKYAANAWIHLYDFQTPNLWSCTG